MKFEVLRNDIAKATRKCQMCEQEIHKGDECIRSPFGSMHKECFGLRSIELLGMAKVEDLYDQEFQDYLEGRVADKI